MLGGPGKERIGLRKVEWGEGRIRTQRCDLAAADWYSSTSHVPSTDKQVSEKQLPTFSVPRPPASLGRTEESVCVCPCVPTLPQNTSCRFRGILYLKTDASLETHTF